MLAVATSIDTVGAHVDKPHSGVGQIMRAEGVGDYHVQRPRLRQRSRAVDNGIRLEVLDVAEDNAEIVQRTLPTRSSRYGMARPPGSRHHPLTQHPARTSNPKFHRR